MGRTLNIRNQLIDTLSGFSCRSFTSKDSHPMRSQKKPASFRKRPFSTAARIKLVHGSQKPSGIRRAAQQVRGFLKCLVILKRQKHNRTIVFLCNNRWFMIVTNTINGLGQVGARFCVGNRIHRFYFDSLYRKVYISLVAAERVVNRGIRGQVGSKVWSSGAF